MVNELQSNAAYAKFFKYISGIPSNTITLNSYPNYDIDEDIMVRWVRMLRPAEVVLPEVPNDREKTLQKAKYFIGQFRRYCNENNIPKYMVVPQGYNKTEWLASAEELINLYDVQCVGIGKDVNLFCSNRLTLLDELKQIAKKKHVHILGVDNKLEELFIIPRKHKWVRSLDTTKIALMSHNRQLLKDQDNVNTSPFPADFYKLNFDKEQIQIFRENMHYIKKSLGHYCL